jgi:hypothetical protein
MLMCRHFVKEEARRIRWTNLLEIAIDVPLKTREEPWSRQVILNFCKSFIRAFCSGTVSLSLIKFRQKVVSMDSRLWNDIDDRHIQEAVRTDLEPVQSQHSGILISRGVGRGCSVHRVDPGGGLPPSFLASRILQQ